MEESVAVIHQTFNPQDVDINPMSMNSPVLLEVETLRGSVITSPKQDMVRCNFFDIHVDYDISYLVIVQTSNMMQLVFSLGIS